MIHQAQPRPAFPVVLEHDMNEGHFVRGRFLSTNWENARALAIDIPESAECSSGFSVFAPFCATGRRKMAGTVVTGKDLFPYLKVPSPYSLTLT